jgi:hypothetical protein
MMSFIVVVQISPSSLLLLLPFSPQDNKQQQRTLNMFKSEQTNVDDKMKDTKAHSFAREMNVYEFVFNGKYRIVSFSLAERKSSRFHIWLL